MRKGFTLAEVLITLGIIGVVAAMSIPTLLAKINDAITISRAKQTYAQLAQAIKLAEEEYDGVCGWNVKFNQAGANDIGNKIKKYLNLAYDCGVRDSEGICVSNKNYKYLNGRTTTVNYANYYYYKMKLLNGVTVFVRGVEPVELDGPLGNDVMCANFFVDLNGPEPPNQGGIDMFRFSYYDNQGLIPYGSIESCLQKVKNNTAKGEECTYYIIHKGKMDYRYK